MIPVEISEAADADLVEILSYGTEALGETQAEAYVASFDEGETKLFGEPFRAQVRVVRT
jgi:plasmid stabilization system protein ParE